MLLPPTSALRADIFPFTKEATALDVGALLESPMTLSNNAGVADMTPEDWLMERIYCPLEPAELAFIPPILALMAFVIEPFESNSSSR